MTQTITKDTLFQPAPTRAQSKADLTNSTARAIIKAETDAREAKTLRLKQARLEMEARRPAPVPAKAAKSRAPKAAAKKNRRPAGRRAA
ncbi:hypothetical protein [Chelativorans sp.]|uniref:hypothetical protein n=1 Tax=Chelativorans sp. TaxID=2203393 RepID=UPI0028111FE7|nr:hypothetical protein [Chelativorans sp.]